MDLNGKDHRQKQQLMTLIGTIGIVGVLEILSEIAEDFRSLNRHIEMQPEQIAFWLRAAAVTKELSEELYSRSSQSKH